jgi:hypothetical protein
MTRLRAGNGRLRAFCIMNRRVTVCGKVKHFRCEAVAKASLNRAIQSQVVDAKPGDLPMARLKGM